MPDEASFPTVPWTPRDVWLGVSTFLVWVVVVLGSRFLLIEVWPNFDVGLFITLGELLLLAPVWWLAIRKYNVGWQSLGLGGFAPSVLWLGCGLMILSVGFNALYGALLARFGQRMQIDLVPVFQDLQSPWLFFLGGAIIAPLVEEIFFRGFVFAGLKPRYGWKRAALISAGIFALLHFTPFAVLPIFILGLIFSYLYHLSGSIWPAILMHILTNSLALGAAYVVANAERFGIPLDAL